MTGQQEATMESVATEEERGGGTLRRIMMLVTVVALMMVMLAMSVAPAFAAQPTWTCVFETNTADPLPPNQVHDFRQAGWTCTKN